MARPGGVAIVSCELLLVCLMIASVSHAVKYKYQCQCTCREPEEPCFMQHSHYVVFDDYIGQSCNDIGDCSGRESNEIYNCQSFQDCCWSNDGHILKCNTGPEHECPRFDNNCTTPTPSDCTCTFVSEEQDDSFEDVSKEMEGIPIGNEDIPNENEDVSSGKDSTLIFGVGIGVGVGVSVLLVAILALLVYCRIQGRREGRRESQKNILVHSKSTAESEIYSEIKDNVIRAGGRSIPAVVNYGYDTSDEACGPSRNQGNVYLGLNKSDMPDVQHQYKSLKKPNQDLGSGDYADPEKYTEPPFLPERNSKVIEEDDDDDDDYISQEGTREPARNDERNSKVTEENDNDDDDYISQEGTPEPARNDERKNVEKAKNDYVQQASAMTTRVTMESIPSLEIATGDYIHVNGEIMPDESGERRSNPDEVSVSDIDSENMSESDYIDM